MGRGAQASLGQTTRGRGRRESEGEAMTGDPELDAAIAKAAAALAARKGNLRDGQVWCASCKRVPAKPTQLECEPCIRGAKMPQPDRSFVQRSFFETEADHDV
jgi:hypothetical protein